MSGSDCGLATSAEVCAIASVIRCSGEKPTSVASPVSDKATVKARRVIINDLLPDWRICAEMFQLRRRSLTKNAPRGNGALWAEVLTKASISLDRGAKPGQRILERLVLHRRQRVGDPLDRRGVRRAGSLGPIAARQGSLPQGNPAHRMPAEEAVDPLQDHVRAVLNFQRHWALHPQHQRGRFLRLARDLPRPL